MEAKLGQLPQPLTEMNIRNLLGVKGSWHLMANCLENVEALTSHNPLTGIALSSFT